MMLARISLLVLSVLALTACGPTESTTAVRGPVAIESGDECHLCGMLIERQPGPKGQLFLRDVQQARKFCSTREMFSYLLQPENRDRLDQAYVHDVARGGWQQPGDDAFIPAREAWYVVGHDIEGAMGHTLASFAQKVDAESFMLEHGGRLLGFDDIQLETLQGGGHHTPH